MRKISMVSVVEIDVFCRDVTSIDERMPLDVILSGYGAAAKDVVDSSSLSALGFQSNKGTRDLALRSHANWITRAPRSRDALLFCKVFISS